MRDIDYIGKDWLLNYAHGMQDSISHITPVEFNEKYRYLPSSVTSIPGYISYSINPFMKEILNCFDVNSPVREVTLKKGVQITYSTLLESGSFYFMGHVKTAPIMYLTADMALSKARVENNFLPMLHQSGLGNIIQSSDIGNTRKSGSTEHHIQFKGGGYLVPFGAKSASKLRSFSIMVSLQDEIDAWPLIVGKDGSTTDLASDRCSAYWEQRKIFRGSTPLIKGQSKIEEYYLKGDQRKYMILCLNCSYPQELVWSGKNEKTGKKFGFAWDIEDNVLQLESVRWHCANCNHAHYEADKELLFSEDHGAHWKPTARPVEPNIRSYHLPSLYSPVGMQPWYKSVSTYLSGFDPVSRKVKNAGAFQVFVNNVLAEPWEQTGSKIHFVMVSAHRRQCYKKGQIPNIYANKHCESHILIVACLVDVHKTNLTIATMGFTKDARCFVIDYFKIESAKKADVGDPSNKVWGKLREFIETKEYIADDNKKYKISMTLIDAGYSNSTVVEFCSIYSSGVYPILGRDRPAKSQKIKEFGEFTTQIGTKGYRIVVDHYKDMLAPILRQEWDENSGDIQKPNSFNAPLDTTDAELKELTVETRREKTDEKGYKSYYWHRPSGARNELFDLLNYGRCAIDILAWSVCIQNFELKNVDWNRFWKFIDENQLYYTDSNVDAQSILSGKT